jgi:hypothetical protein
MRSRVPKTSQRALKTDKMRTPLARKSHLRGPDIALETSLLCDVLTSARRQSLGGRLLI